MLPALPALLPAAPAVAGLPELPLEPPALLPAAAPPLPPPAIALGAPATLPPLPADATGGLPAVELTLSGGTAEEEQPNAATESGIKHAKARVRMAANLHCGECARLCDCNGNDPNYPKSIEEFQWRRGVARHTRGKRIQRRLNVHRAANN